MESILCTLWTALETNLARQKDTEGGSGMRESSLYSDETRDRQ